jgi:hypothetical protein
MAEASAFLHTLKYRKKEYRFKMNADHKNKTAVSLLSALGGAFGLHRFYLYGHKDIFGWIYLSMSSVYLAVAGASWSNPSLDARVAFLFPIPVFVAAIEALVIGLTDDAKWDRRHNVYSPDQTRSGWRLVVLLVLTLAITFTAFVAGMARAVDLLYTGGNFG